ncbi:MAG TPA: hypothetical protein VKB45_10755 [Gemmatimonadales bacterium]|nr:hypothetical protein [Gemmatimonadales bacterium]
MRAFWFAVSMAAATTLTAQNPADSGVAADSGRLALLRKEIIVRYLARAHEVLGLTPDQAVKFDSTQARAWEQRRQLLVERQQINMAMRDQMRPGMPANPDSVSKLLESRRRVTESLFRVDDQEDREMTAYLNPVQRAQYQEFRQHFRERIAEAVRNRPGLMRPGIRPGLRPGVGRRRRP